MLCFLYIPALLLHSFLGQRARDLRHVTERGCGCTNCTAHAGQLHVVTVQCPF